MDPIIFHLPKHTLQLALSTLYLKCFDIDKTLEVEIQESEAELEAIEMKKGRND